MLNYKISLVTLLLVTTIFNCSFATNVTLDIDGVIPYASSNATSYFSLIAETPASSPGESTTSPVIIYSPIAASADHLLYTTVSDSSLLPSTAENDGYLKIEMIIDNTTASDTLYLTAAVDDENGDSAYKVVQLNSAINIAASTTTTYAYPTLSFYEICQQSSCSLSNSSDSKVIYFYLDSINRTVGEEVTIDGSSNTGGKYFKVYLSDHLESTAPTLVSISKGDERANVEISGSNITNLYQTLIFSHSNTSTAISTSLELGNATGTQLQTTDPIYSGTVNVTGLTNGVTYNLSIGLVDKYLYSSKLSTSALVTPEDIIALLEKQFCFLLTAGFHGEHYIIDYFRNLRDTVLIRSSWGQKFINWYYRTAPHYALTIHRSKPLSAMIRASAHILYFLFNYFYIILTVIAALTISFTVRSHYNKT